MTVLYAFEFIYNKYTGKWKDTTPQTHHINITMKDKHNTQHTLSYISHHEARQTLGTWIAPEGNMKKQTKSLIDKSRQWAAQIRSRHVQRHDAWASLHTKIMKSIEYPLPATTLAQTKCNKIMSIILQAALPKLGICQHMNRDAVYIPTTIQGLGIRHPYSTQHTGNIQTLLEKLYTTTTEGLLFKETLQTLNLEIGTQSNPLNTTYSTFGHLATNNTWIKCLWS